MMSTVHSVSKLWQRGSDMQQHPPRRCISPSHTLLCWRLLVRSLCGTKCCGTSSSAAALKWHIRQLLPLRGDFESDNSVLDAAAALQDSSHSSTESSGNASTTGQPSWRGSGFTCMLHMPAEYVQD